MIDELWADISGYETLYRISNHGRVKRLARSVICKNGMPKPLREQMLTPHSNTRGYLWVHLHSAKGKSFRFIHRLVADAFTPNPEHKPFVNHKSGCKTQNEASNLEWVTRKENVSHAFATGLMSHAGEKNSQSKLTTNAVAGIRADRLTGMRVVDIAAKYEMSRRRVYDVINNRCWKVA